jgi:hypothetical protein
LVEIGFSFWTIYQCPNVVLVNGTHLFLYSNSSPWILNSFILKFTTSLVHGFLLNLQSLLDKVVFVLVDLIFKVPLWEHLMSRYAHVEKHLLVDVVVVLDPLMDDLIFQIMVIMLGS